MIDHVLTAFNEAIFDTDRQRALRVIHEAEQDGILPEDIVFKVVVPSIHIMMKSTSERRTPSIAQHFVAAQIASEVTGHTIGYTVLPRLAFRLGGLVNPAVKESEELLPRYAENNLFDSSKFTDRFPDFRATTYNEGITALLS